MRAEVQQGIDDVSVVGSCDLKWRLSLHVLTCKRTGVFLLRVLP